MKGNEVFVHSYNEILVCGEKSGPDDDDDDDDDDNNNDDDLLQVQIQK